MLRKWIFLLQVTLSVKQEKIRELNPVETLVRSNREKIRRRVEGFRGDNIVVNKTVRLRRLFNLLFCILYFHRYKAYDPLTLFTLSIFLLKKLLLILIFIVCKLMDDLLNELLEGN